MKKILVVLVALLSIVVFSVTAIAADLKTNQETAIQRLGELTIMEGDANGNFRADANLTRAEFAKIAVIAGGFKATAQSLAQSKSDFTDVKASAWYTGYINAAVQEGLITGYADKTYKPSQTITNQEVLSVILRLMGYTNLTGTWPTNYLNLALEQGLTSNVSTGTAKAVRGNVAVMVNAALDKSIVEWNSTTKKYDVQKATDGTAVTLLAQIKAINTEASGTYYGVVLDYTLTDKVVTSVKIFNQEGNTVTYPVAMGVYADISQDKAIKAGTAYKGYVAIEKGTLLKYGVDKTGNIIKDYSSNYTVDSDSKGVTNKTNKTIVFDGTTYTLTKDAHIFNLTLKNNQLNVELISLDKALISNILYGNSFTLNGGTYPRPGLAAIIPDITSTRTLDNLVLANYATSSGTSYGFVEECGFSDGDGDAMVSFYGDPVSYKIASGSSAGIAEGKLYDCYKSGDGGLKLLELLRTDFVALNGTVTKQTCEVTEASSGLLNVEKIGNSSVTAQYEITDDTVIYNYNWSSPDDDPEYTDGVEKGDRIYLLTNAKNEVLLMIIDTKL